MREEFQYPPGSLARRAIAMQRLGRWEAAARLWGEAGDSRNARACRLVDDAVRAGDGWRARVAGLMAGGIDRESAYAQATEEQRSHYAQKKS